MGLWALLSYMVLGLQRVEARLGCEWAGGVDVPHVQEQAVEETEARFARLLAKWKRRRDFPFTFYGI